MIKKGFIAGIVTVAMVLTFAVFKGKWSYLYFVSGTFGTISLVLALAYLIDVPY
ncbi:hypothetical protein ACLHDF_03450 [Priestia aryabhattai]|uniref:hypothetical protein n=1 Tax=Priestia megaterium TaxID=1404 RepID=UPI0039B9A31E